MQKHLDHFKRGLGDADEQKMQQQARIAAMEKELAEGRSEAKEKKRSLEHDDDLSEQTSKRSRAV